MMPIRAVPTTTALVLVLFTFPTDALGQSNDALIKEALSAAPATIALDATVVDWEENVLRQGDNGWVCFPSPPETSNSPMCFDEAWSSFGQSWMNRDPNPIGVDQVGIAYMLQGDDGSSNVDPWAEGPAPDNEWVVEGPHLMIIVPDPAALEGLPTDPDNGGPYVMWRDTPYAHIMVPIH